MNASISKTGEGNGTPLQYSCPSPMHEVKSESKVAQSCPTLSDPMDCSLPGSSRHGIFQARVLEWGAIAFSRFRNGCIHLKNLFGKINRNSYGNCKVRTKRKSWLLQITKAKLNNLNNMGLSLNR